MTDIFSLTANKLVEKLKEGEISSVEVCTQYIDRIKKFEKDVKAWAHFDKKELLEKAAEADEYRKSGKPLGVLHGLPVAIKDIIGTLDMPTECGTVLRKKMTGSQEAEVVNLLKIAGAIIMGKTETTELAYFHPGRTTNPHDHSRTPGGSSSGSAAAVAANHVPIAVGTQTNGSVIRPASFCGTYGFKPSSGTIPRSGVLQTSQTLDQVGCFGRSLADVGLLSDVLGSYDQNDLNSFSRPRPKMMDGALSEPPVTPDLAWLDLPFYDRLALETREGLDSITDILGTQVTKMTAADQLSNLVAVQARIHEYEICKHQRMHLIRIGMV